MTPYTCFLDLLHVIDHRGIAAELIGNVFWTAISNKELAPTYQASLDIINAEISDFYSRCAVQHRLPTLTLANIIPTEQRASSYPVLTGPVVKAANCRALLPYVLELAARLDDGITPEKIHRRKAAQWLGVIVDLFYSSPMFLNDDMKARLAHAVNRFSLHFSWLTSHACARGMACGI